MFVKLRKQFSRSAMRCAGARNIFRTLRRDEKLQREKFAQDQMPFCAREFIPFARKMNLAQRISKRAGIKARREPAGDLAFSDPFQDVKRDTAQHPLRKSLGRAINRRDAFEM